MPNGNVHSAATVALAVTAGYLMYHNGSPLPQTLAVTGGVLAGLVLTPDLDVDQGSVSNRIVRRSAGKLTGGLWSIFWLPYSRLIPHRSPLSHTPLLGTALRLAYFFGIPLLLYSLVQGALFLPTIPSWATWSAFGLALADLGHYVMDKVF